MRAERGASARTGAAPVTPGVDAVYMLDSIAGRALPAAEDEPAPGEPRLEVVAETLWLRRDGSFTARSHWREAPRDRSSLGVYADSGRYTLEQSPTVSADGLLLSGDVVLRSRPNRSARLWARDEGRFLVGPGLPRAPGGTAILVPFTYRRVPRQRG